MEYLSRLTFVDLVFFFVILFVLLGGFFAFILPYFRFRRFKENNEWQIFAHRIQIESELERYVTSDQTLSKKNKETLLAEIRGNQFCEWGAVYLDGEASVDLPLSVWRIMLWLTLRRKPETVSFVRTLEEYSFAKLTTSRKIQIFLNHPGLPNHLAHAPHDELDKEVRNLFPNTTMELMHYRDLMLRRHYYA